MREQSDKKNLMLDDGTQLTGLNRWIPTIIVFCVVAGFFTLSWYAYHAGMQSVKEEDLLIVEADTGPLKEKPSDPGGMQFPNQDKTIFETFGNTESKPQRVERILPTPEEPMSKDAEDNTKTWVNKKTTNALSANTDEDGTRTEILISSATPPPSKESEKAEGYVAKREDTKTSFVQEKLKEREAEKARLKAHKEKALKEKMEKEQAAAEAEKREAAKKREIEIRRKEDASTQAAKERAAEQKTAMQKSDNAPSSQASNTGAQMVQLGAFRSNDEANRAWETMHIKHKILSDKRPTVVRADLGEKGVYYRLRVANLDDAKTLCTVLKSTGQACLPVSAK